MLGSKWYAHTVLNLFTMKQSTQVAIVKTGNPKVLLFSRISYPVQIHILCPRVRNWWQKDLTLLITLVTFKPHVFISHSWFLKARESKDNVAVMSYDLVFQHTVNFKRNFISTFSDVPSCCLSQQLCDTVAAVYPQSISTILAK